MAWNPFGVAFEVSASSTGVTRTSATQYTVKIKAAWETYYSGAETNYGMKASSGGGSVTLNPSGTYASSGSGSFTGTYSISGNGSATKTITVTFTNYIEDWQGNVTDSKTTTVTFNVTVPAWTSYTVSYNANGGSGAPSSQTKWKDQTLTLNFNTIPTRTGYTFLGYSTSSTATSATWTSSNKSYTANSGATLYAVWRINTYTNTIKHWRYVGTGGNNEAGTMYCANDNSTFTSTYNSTTIIPSNLIKSYSGYHNTGIAGSGDWGSSWSSKNIGSTFTQPAKNINIEYYYEPNTYTIGYNANGGSGNMNSQTVEWQETFTLFDNTFKREGYKFIGWNLYRNADSKWYVNGQGWLTESEIISNGYEKKLYENQDELILDMSWIRDNEDAKEFTLYAVWEISGVIYIDNGTAFEPYLAYIDSGSEWELYLTYVDNGTSWNIIS